MRGRDDGFRTSGVGLRHVGALPGADLVEVAVEHIPAEDSPGEAAEAVVGRLAG